MFAAPHVAYALSVDTHTLFREGLGIITSHPLLQLQPAVKGFVAYLTSISTLRA